MQKYLLLNTISDSFVSNVGTAPNIKLKRTWQPVTPVACATSAPERPRRLTWCYAALES